MGVYTDQLLSRTANALSVLASQPGDKARQVDAAWRLRDAAQWLEGREVPTGPVGAAIRRFRGDG